MGRYPHCSAQFLYATIIYRNITLPICSLTTMKSHILQSWFTSQVASCVVFFNQWWFIGFAATSDVEQSSPVASLQRFNRVKNIDAGMDSKPADHRKENRLIKWWDIADIYIYIYMCIYIYTHIYIYIYTGWCYSYPSEKIWQSIWMTIPNMRGKNPNHQPNDQHKSNVTKPFLPGIYIEWWQVQPTDTDSMMRSKSIMAPGGVGKILPPICSTVM